MVSWLSRACWLPVLTLMSDRDLFSYTFWLERTWLYHGRSWSPVYDTPMWISDTVDEICGKPYRELQRRGYRAGDFDDRRPLGQ